MYRPSTREFHDETARMDYPFLPGASTHPVNSVLSASISMSSNTPLGDPSTGVSINLDYSAVGEEVEITVSIPDSSVPVAPLQETLSASETFDLSGDYPKLISMRIPGSLSGMGAHLMLVLGAAPGEGVGAEASALCPQVIREVGAVSPPFIRFTPDSGPEFHHSGAVELVPGYHMRIIPGGGTLTWLPELGGGEGYPDNDFYGDPGEDAATVESVCATLITSINGVAPDLAGDIVLRGGPGVIVNPVISENEIVVSFDRRGTNVACD